MPIQSFNPFTNQVEETFDELSDSEIESALSHAAEVASHWRETSIETRTSLLKRLSEVTIENAAEYGALATREMGKLLSEAVGWELPICASIADYYGANAAEFLRPNNLSPTSFGTARVERHPIGVLLGIMPWNYPFYQVFRFVCPNIAAGNVCMIKHASNVPQTAEAIERLFRLAGFPDGVFTNLRISSRKTEQVIADARVRGVSLTGSEKAGSIVASQAGKYLKKVVLELGGSDPFIVLDDADVGHSVEMAIKGRMFNSGQSCVAAKRFIVCDSVYQEFVDQFVDAMRSFVSGDPMESDATYAPLVNLKERDAYVESVAEAESAGANILVGGKPEDLPGAWLRPTVVTEVTPEMPIYYKELFGPVAVVHQAKSDEDATRLANDSPYGLGAAIMSTDQSRADSVAATLNAGMVFINVCVSTEAELPFGGVKNSGFGRELANLGMEEFVNHKLIRTLS